MSVIVGVCLGVFFLLTIAIGGIIVKLRERERRRAREAELEVAVFTDTR